MRFANADKLHRKSGGAKPRDLQFTPSATNVLPTHLFPGMLYDAYK